MARETLAARSSAQLARVVLLSVLAHDPAAAAETGLLGDRRITIESAPPGAVVYVIGGKAGTTPLTITERDIYPNTYPDERAGLYGKVFIKKAGCADYSKRLTLDDIGAGLRAELDCTETTPPAPVSVSTASTEAPAGERETHARRRLTQLKVLQELLDDGLISADEERSIRTRILDAE